MPAPAPEAARTPFVIDAAARALFAHHERCNPRRWFRRVGRERNFDDLTRKEQRHWRAMAIVAKASFDATRVSYLPDWAQPGAAPDDESGLPY